ncbi:MAG: carboxypeptidase regulatory-like domain-containing protein, partial [bacterium]|nr:carboxypeptidase regulatory-like domain-containing protein [bacterium]
WIGELSVTVTDDEGLPVADAAVSLSSDDGACLRNGLSNASGEFLSEMLPLADDYLLSVSGPDGSGLGGAEETGISVSDQAADVEISLSGADESDGDVCDDYPVSPADAVLPDAGPDEITGRVADVMGTLPPENMFVSVRVFEKDGRFLKRVTAAADGTFRITGLDAEKEYQLLVRVIGSNLPLQWVRYVGGFGFSLGIGRDRGLAGAYSPGTAVSIMLNNDWLW